MKLIFKSSVLSSLLFLFTLPIAESAEHYFTFSVNDDTDLKKLTRMISIDKVKEGWVWAYANDQEFANFETLNYKFELLQHPGTLIHPRMTDNMTKAKSWDAYPTYNAYVEMMYQFATDFPDLCKIENIGQTVEGRDLLVAKISDNVTTDESEPEFFYTSTMHGDETTGYVLMLRLIDYLLNQYGVDDELTQLVDTCEIWINPLANPDGTYHSGDTTVYNSTRYNANYDDLNRSFPNPGQAFNIDDLEPEVKAMVTFARNRHFVMGANLHGGAEVLNYPWDRWERRHADDEWYQQVCRQYADIAQAASPPGYLTDLENGITNGYDWYQTFGNRQDYMNYYHHCREITMEISDIKLVPASELENFWNYNRDAFIKFIKNVCYGIHGSVTDSAGNPIKSEIFLTGHDKDSSQVFSDAQIGDFHRLCASGTWNMEVRAPYYQTVYYDSLIITDLTRLSLNIILDDLKGDLNNDGWLTQTDIEMLMDSILVNNIDAELIKIADINEDGKVDVRDTVLLINRIGQNSAKTTTK